MTDATNPTVGGETVKRVKRKYLCGDCGKRVAVRRGAFGEPYPYRHDPPNGGLCHGHYYEAVEDTRAAITKATGG
jgi:hypothetical protein